MLILLRGILRTVISAALVVFDGIILKMLNIFGALITLLISILRMPTFVVGRCMTAISVKLAIYVGIILKAPRELLVYIPGDLISKMLVLREEYQGQ